jgi:ABC-type polysaccharide/polyol phosphate export permease
MTRIITQSREAVVYQGWPDGVAMLQTFLFTGFVMIAGWWTFRRMQARLVEHI